MEATTYTTTYTLGRFGQQTQDVTLSAGTMRRAAIAAAEGVYNAEDNANSILLGAILMKLPVGAKLVDARVAQ